MCVCVCVCVCWGGEPGGDTLGGGGGGGTRKLTSSQFKKKTSTVYRNGVPTAIQISSKGNMTPTNSKLCQLTKNMIAFKWAMGYRNVLYIHLHLHQHLHYMAALLHSCIVETCMYVCILLIMQMPCPQTEIRVQRVVSFLIVHSQHVQ